MAADAGKVGGEREAARCSAPVLPVLSSAGGAVSTTTTFFFTARFMPMPLCLPGILESNAVAAVSGVPACLSKVHSPCTRRSGCASEWGGLVRRAHDWRSPSVVLRGENGTEMEPSALLNSEPAV